MTTEFVFPLNLDTFPNEQVLPDEFKDECFDNKKRDLYLTGHDRFRSRVNIVKRNNGQIVLTGGKWSEFARQNFDRDVKWIHFVEEGDDSFYVTGYYNSGAEFGGYDGVRGRPMRFLTRLSPFENIAQEFVPKLPVDLLSDLPVIGPIIVSVFGENHVVGVNRVRETGGYVYQLVVKDWEAVVERMQFEVMHLEVGSFFVFTKVSLNEFRLLVFGNDGSPAMDVDFHGATTLLRGQRPLNDWEQKDVRLQHICYWPSHRDHFGEEDDTFYVKFERISDLQRLTIPAKFLEKHPMHGYTKVLIKHQDIQEVMSMRMQVHHEDPGRTNNVKVSGPWNWFAERCGFGNTKMIRFRYMYNVQDVLSDNEVEPDSDEDSDDDSFDVDEYPCFHLC